MNGQFEQDMAFGLASPASQASCELRASIQRPNGRVVDVQLIQLGREEARIRLAVPLTIGEIITLQVLDGGEVAWDCAGEVHWQGESQREVEVGLYLNREVPEDFLLWPLWDKREQLRFPVHLHGQIWWDGDRESHPVVVTNYSSSGMGLQAQQSGRVGAEAQVYVQHPGVPPIVVRGTACWQVAHSEGYLIGCELPEFQGRRFSGTCLYS